MTFTNEDNRLVLRIGTDIEIKSYDGDEIFTKPNSKAYLMMSETGSGKSVTVCDVVRSCL